MKITEFIEMLEEAEKKFGDVDVYIPAASTVSSFDINYDADKDSVEVWV